MRKAEMVAHLRHILADRKERQPLEKRRTGNKIDKRPLDHRMRNQMIVKTAYSVHGVGHNDLRLDVHYLSLDCHFEFARIYMFQAAVRKIENRHTVQLENVLYALHLLSSDFAHLIQRKAVLVTLFCGAALRQGQKIDLVAIPFLMAHRACRTERLVIRMRKYVEYSHRKSPLA